MKTKLYFTSDWHIGHANSLKFDNRPFADLDDMHTQLVKTFNYWVPKHGITYFLGDFAMGDISTAQKVLKALNGRKVLIRGNHDRNFDSCYNMGFDLVLNKAEIMLGKHRITMSHCPLRGIHREDLSSMLGTKPGEHWHGESRHSDWASWPDEGQFHLHGHIHSPNKGRSQKILGRQFDVGVPANKYKPVSIGEIQSWINSYDAS